MDSKIFFKKIKQALTMKQSMREEPEYENIPPLDCLVKDLMKIDDVFWGNYVFSRDILNEKFSDDDRRRWIFESLNCGRKYAQMVAEKAQSSDPATISSLLGAKIYYIKEDQGRDHALFANFTTPNEIHIVSNVLKSIEPINIDGNIIIDSSSVEKVLIAHELFHYIEETNKKEIFTRNEKVELWSIGSFKNTSTIRSLGEIAAMSFSKELNGIGYSPFILDVIIVYGFNKNLAYKIYTQVMDMCSSK